jgi:hypothetical protein
MEGAVGGTCAALLVAIYACSCTSSIDLPSAGAHRADQTRRFRRQAQALVFLFTARNLVSTPLNYNLGQCGVAISSDHTLLLHAVHGKGD